MSDLAFYRRYVAWCQKYGYKPADEQTWREISETIPTVRTDSWIERCQELVDRVMERHKGQKCA